VSEPTPLMYGPLAPWFHLLSPPEDYDDEAVEILDLMQGSADAPVVDVLELGSGGGSLASRFEPGLRLTLTDPAAAMLELSERVNPDAEHILADMRDIRLGRIFDAVVAHDAVTYMRTESDLRAALETAFVHVRSGGGAVFAPDWVLDTFVPATESGGGDEASGRGVRYLEWDRPIEADGVTVATDYVIVTREADGTTEVHHDEHRLGIFSRDTWLRLLTDVGFEPRIVDGAQGLDIFVASRP
jgi:SAM-dependent methyltransferase